ncbi:MAG: glycosyltransferase family 2 protein [Dehalococcoidia bacterium]
MSALAGSLAIALSVLVLLHTVPWIVLSVLAIRRPRGELTAAPMRLAVIVPAHDEEAGIGRTVASLRAAPFEPRPEIIVVADNCRDATASIARAAGATVLERYDSSRRGKAFAINHAVAALRERPRPPDAVIVVDADTTVSANVYCALSSRLAGGAEAVQVHYEPAPSRAPVARLRRVAMALVHWSRPLGMARLGLGTGIKGNGFALSWRLARGGFAGHGLAEDASLTLALARQGLPVRFEARATVRGEMAETYAAASTQDRRWERGRLALIPQALAVAAKSVLRGRLAAAAGALDVATLPLSLLAMAGVVALSLAVASGESLMVAGAALASLVAYVAAGAAAARVSPGEFLALVHAPRFVAHKLAVYAQLLAGRGLRAWERTARQAPARKGRGAS